tara:strand:+ start:240 stop:491 length:252 start_codon:yes stop_codon:yes gene_type:complete
MEKHIIKKIKHLEKITGELSIYDNEFSHNQGEISAYHDILNLIENIKNKERNRRSINLKIKDLVLLLILTALVILSIQQGCNI